MMTKEEYYRSRDLLINKIATSSNKEKKQLLTENSLFLENIDFICVDEKDGHDNFSEFLNTFSVNKEKIIIPFYSNKIKVYNLQYVIGKKTTFRYMYDICLDTQVVSYIDRYIKGNLSKDLQEQIEWLHVARKYHSVVNMDAYILENQIKNGEISDIMKENIYSFFLFLNEPIMRRKKAERSSRKRLKLILKFQGKAKYPLAVYELRYTIIYCILMKIVLLKFEKTSIKNKMKKIIKFLNEEVYCLVPMFFPIALRYWKNKLNFFDKIVPNQKRILEILKNMSWDLFHWQNAMLTFNPNIYEISDVYVPIFFTMDKKLKEVIQAIKINCVVIDKQRNLIFPYYDLSEFDSLFSKKEMQELLGINQYKIREENRGKADRKALEKRLENEIIDLGIFQS